MRTVDCTVYWYTFIGLTTSDYVGHCKVPSYFTLIWSCRFGNELCIPSPTAHNTQRTLPPHPKHKFIVFPTRSPHYITPSVSVRLCVWYDKYANKALAFPTVSIFARLHSAKWWHSADDDEQQSDQAIGGQQQKKIYLYSVIHISKRSGKSGQLWEAICSIWRTMPAPLSITNTRYGIFKYCIHNRR